MLDPEYLRDVVDGAVVIAQGLHEYIIREIIRRMLVRMGRGADYLLTSSDRRRLQVLQESGYLLEDIQKEIARRTGFQLKELQEAFEQAGVDALAYDDAIYRRAGISPTPLQQSPHLIRIMEQSYRRTAQTWQNFTRTTAYTAQQTFIRECDTAYQKVASGAVAYTQAVREAVAAASRDGALIRWTDSGGRVYHTDTIETATARAVRTGIAQMSGDVPLTRAPVPETAGRTPETTCGGRGSITAKAVRTRGSRISMRRQDTVPGRGCAVIIAGTLSAVEPETRRATHIRISQTRRARR